MPDPYAKRVGVNGNHSLIFDPKLTNPSNWKTDKQPPLKSASEVILYEAHVRYFSIDPSSGIKKQRKISWFS